MPESRLAVRFGWVSLFQDLGSKMVVPFVPLFLAVELGASPAEVGLIDGLSTVSAAVTAAIAGRRSRRAPVMWVRAGYGLSSAMKLALAGAASWSAVMAVRVADRAGKGLRDAPRDALLARDGGAQAGRTFGVQQAMDKTGGFLGPILGLVVYELSDHDFRAVFVVGFVPCALSVALLGRLPTTETTTMSSTATSPHAPIASSQRWALVASTLHAAGYVSVSLLLLRALDGDVSVGSILIGFALFRLAAAITSYPVGRLADRAGPRVVVVVGMGLAGLGVGAVAVAESTFVVWVGLGVAGVADSMTRGPAKAWLIGLGAPAASSVVLGDRSALTGAAALVSSVTVGLAWGNDGEGALLVAAALCFAAAILASAIPPRRAGQAPMTA